MRPNTINLLDLSTGHLSLETREWLEEPANAERAGVTPRTHGYFVTAQSGDDFPDVGRVPLDLVHCMRYAGANGASYVLFDTDAMRQDGLPWYEDGNTPDLSGTGLKFTDLFWDDGASAMMVNPNDVTREDLRVERTWTETLEDGDYEAPEGAWIGIGDASVRINTDARGDLKMSVFARGAEDQGPISETGVLRDDIRNARPDVNEDEGPDI